MDDQSVCLSEREWQAVMGLISLAPWRDANPLLMKIGEQLRGQQPQPGAGTDSIRMPGPNSKDKEMRS